MSSAMLVAQGQLAIVCLIMFWYCSEHCSHQNLTSCNDTKNYQLKILWYPSTAARPLLKLNLMYPHVHFELGENRASIHFFRHLIHRRNRQFLPLNCLVGMPHVDAYIHIILVWLRSYHSWADPGCWAWNLVNDVKVKKLVNLCLNFIFQRVRIRLGFCGDGITSRLMGNLSWQPDNEGSK